MGSPARGGLESVSRRQLSIHVRVLFLACMCTLLAVTVAVTSYLYRSLLQSNQQEAQSLAEYLSPALEFDDQPAVADYLASLSNSPDVLHARVLRLDGGPSYAEYSAGGPGAATNFYSELFGLAPLTVRADINYRDQRRGQLELSVSLDTLIRTTAVICGFVALTSASFMALLILTSRRLNRAISNPLESMAELMARVSESGDYQSRAATSELAEIDDLSRGFNELMARIASREAQIAKLANFDSLTGLRNRRGFLKRVEREIQAAEREGSALLLMYVDVDHFKSVNDSLGHDIGDEVLVEVAARIQSVLRPTDTVSRASEDQFPQLARLGGDEFTVLLTRVAEPHDGLLVADRICAAVRQPVQLASQNLAVSCSIGVAAYPGDGNSAAELVQHADSAMYHAKQQGRDQVRYYDDEMTRLARRRLWLSNRLREALEHDELRLEYQPMIDPRDGSVVAVEALLRWTLEGEGPVSPAEFVPIAESSGLIVPLGRWVLRRACFDVMGLNVQLHRPLRLAVNISPAQVQEPAFAAMVQERLSESGLAPQLLELEVTEEMLIRSSQATVQALEALSAMGVRIALDDFGTGYSSLSYLKALPIQVLKVDRSFVAGLPEGQDDLAIVRAVLAMAHALNLDVTAEGVETAEQRDLLAQMGCDLLQGFHYSCSVPLTELTALCSTPMAVAAGGGR